MNSYWLAYGLAKKGHKVHVVTNGEEVESEHKINMSEEDREQLQLNFQNGGEVTVHYTDYFDKNQYYIPFSNPFITKLSTLATRVVESFKCEVIFSYYFEPYMIAGYLVSLWTRVPHFTRHAGSDLSRLMGNPSLGTSYKRIINSVDGIVTPRRGKAYSQLINLGLYKKINQQDILFGLPKEHFNKKNKIDNLKRNQLSEFIVGIYGKVGEFKGSFDLLEAISILKKAGYNVKLNARTQGRGLKIFKEKIKELDISDNVNLSNFTVHHNIPQFIAECDVVCCLERGFPVDIHGPIIPREVLACGSTLLLSGEIYFKQFYKNKMIDKNNFMLIKDPRNIHDLVSKLEYLIMNRDKCNDIGLSGAKLSDEIEADMFERYINDIEEMFIKGIKSPQIQDIIKACLSLLPLSYRMLDERLVRIIKSNIKFYDGCIHTFLINTLSEVDLGIQKVEEDVISLELEGIRLVLKSNEKTLYMEKNKININSNFTIYNSSFSISKLIRDNLEEDMTREINQSPENMLIVFKGNGELNYYKISDGYLTMLDILKEYPMTVEELYKKFKLSYPNFINIEELINKTLLSLGEKEVIELPRNFKDYLINSPQKNVMKI
ncbi:glycosyltransferase [Priestia megaterium]|uniref:glycosyltransferase n=1 Tax=Priestia megaterium TaxID=1404 RepID=UPI002EA6192D|nr:glycosyltransferase [Priestia megaterium]